MTIEMLMSAKYAKSVLCDLTKNVSILKYEYMTSEFVIFEKKLSNNYAHMYLISLMCAMVLNDMNLLEDRFRST